MLYADATLPQDPWTFGWTAVAAIGTAFGAVASAVAALVAVLIANRARTESAILRLQRQRDEALRVEVAPGGIGQRHQDSGQPDPPVQFAFTVSNLGRTAIRNVGGYVTTGGAGYSVTPVKVVPAGARGYNMSTDWGPRDDAGGAALLTLWFEDSSGTWWELRDGWADKRDGPGPYPESAPDAGR